MKNKTKFLLIFSLAVLFSLSLFGCGEAKDAVDYNETALVNLTQSVVMSYDTVSDSAAEYYAVEGTKLEQTAVAGFRSAKTTDNVGEFVMFSSEAPEFTVNSNGTILCSIVCKYENRDVKVSTTCEKDLSYEMQKEKLLAEIRDMAAESGMIADDYVAVLDANFGYGFNTTSASAWLDDFLAVQGVSQYKATECEVSAIYSKKELLGMAGKNTIIGISTVFVVLIFISFIISLLQYVPALVGSKDAKKPAAKNNKADKKAEIKETKNEEIKVPAASENLMNDAELVAVITAAIYAAEAANGAKAPNAISKDKLVVRSIRRAR